MGVGQTFTLDDIKDMLLARLDAVVQQYAPPANGSHTTHGKYFTLNPGRADRSVGSFCITMTGPKAGRWNDYATGEHGDVIDLIALSCVCDLSAAVREARGFLGLRTADPAEISRQKERSARLKQDRERLARQDRARADKRARQAHAIWLSGQQQLRGTPVEYYLRDQRGIDLGQLGRQPRVLRYVPECYYSHTDPETGEYVEGRFPAMVALVTNVKGAPVACHRTYLAIGPEGRWNKAPVSQPKKVLGSYAGAFIPIWKGIGPRGGKPASLSAAPPDTRVFITEGIEDALSAVMLMPEQRILAAISLGNLGQVQLPRSVSAVTIIADLDENDAARAALERAVASHKSEGRRVALFQNKWGGKDLNDALRDAQSKDEDQGDE